jgi:hypothetical protein
VIGKTVSHYRILSQLGLGGMGVVYGGEDIRLGRAVALKFVPEELGRDTPAIHRLHSEARTASGLNHPNICTIYDIGEHDGRPFVVMELLKGQTLRERLARSPLKIHEAVDIGIQVADALDAAHQHGIVHRDIKPANVFLVDHGPAKVLDFGLAKLVVEHTSATTEGPTIDRTAEGLTVGTVSYMSPEQVSGEPLDARTDLFSLGVVLYESLTGRQPFPGKTSAVIFSAILTRAAVAPVVFNPNVSPRLQEVINNCLEKSRELRYPDAAALRADLKRVKRDLESGQSSVFRIPVPALDASKESPAGTRSSGSVPAADGEGLHASVQAAVPHRRARVLAGVLVPVLVIGVGALWVASHRLPPASPKAGENDSFVRTQLGLAAASLDAKDFRAALAYADQVLRVLPDDPTASRVRDEARQSIARFNDALARAGERLAAGDSPGAASALADARAIDPGAPAVSDLAARLAGAPTRREPPVVRARPAPPDSPARSVSPPPPAAVGPAPSEAPPGRTEQVNVPASAPPPVTPPPTPAPVAAEPAVVAPPPADVSPPQRAAPAPEPRQAETDETAIRRVVATYARAIETKDLALFRTVKPNMSADEQRRIEDGFRAVSAQRVRLTILSIEPHGQEATVHVQRRDTIQAAGREQTADSVQTMTLARGTSGWVIRDIR